MKDIDNISFTTIKEMDDPLTALSKTSRYFGAYNPSEDKMFFWFQKRDSTHINLMEHWFVYVLNHEFMHRILTQNISRAVSGRYDLIDENRWIDLENLFPLDFLKFL